MKKILLILLFITAGVNAQSYFYNTTLGTTGIRITALESTNYSTTDNPLIKNGKQWITITGYADGEIQFSFGDSLFATKSSFSVSANTPIPFFNVWLPKYSTPIVWIKSSSGTINVDIQYRVW